MANGNKNNKTQEQNRREWNLMVPSFEPVPVSINTKLYSVLAIFLSEVLSFLIQLCRSIEMAPELQASQYIFVPAVPKLDSLSTG